MPTPGITSLINSFALNRVARQTDHKNMYHLIQLRWMAVLGQIITIAVAHQVFKVTVPLPQIFAVLVCLVAFNLGSYLRWHEAKAATDSELFLSLLVDVLGLTFMLYFTGGINNPFATLFMLQVILGVVLLKTRTAWMIVVIITSCLVFLALFNRPIVWPTSSPFAFHDVYVVGVLISFSLNAGLLVLFVSRITSNLRAGDRALADLRQKAAEEDHIVRMGLLASGAAHELGTPLSTMSVLVGDWKHLDAVRSEPELLEDLQEFDQQLNRCKSIVSNVLMSAGEARGESSSATTLMAFFESLAQQWEQSSRVKVFDYENHIEEDFAIVSDSALKQAVTNLLDNSAHASPHFVRLDVSVMANQVHIAVTDDGPGFAPEVLEHLGKPYQSTKQTPGSGLGIFLVMNVARSLGGQFTARNREEGGAAVALTIPLSSLRLESA